MNGKQQALSHSRQINASILIAKVTPSAALLAAFLFLFTSTLSLAIEVSLEPTNNTYLHKSLAQSTANGQANEWLAPVPVPQSDDKYFHLNRNGELYAINGVNESALITSFSGSQQSGFITATAIAVHPSFSQRDQSHSGKFYLAHIEEAQPSKRGKKINNFKDDMPLNFDLVVSEWQMSILDNSRLQPDSQREILRIGVPSSDYPISTLKFDPHSRPWDSDYGLLHIGVSAPNNQLQHAVFSGAILRIQPDNFGVRPYTVPSDNPFVKPKEVAAEVVAYGLGKIHDIVWGKTLHNRVLVDHSNGSVEQFSLVAWGEDWHQQHARSIIWQANKEEVVTGRFSYLGANLPKLRNQLVFLTQSAQNWQLLALPITVKTDEHAAPQVTQLTINSVIAEQLSDNCQLIENSNNELLLVDQQNSQAYQLISLVNESNEQQSKNAQPNQQITEASGESSHAAASLSDGATNSATYLIIALIVSALLFAFYGYRKKRQHGQFPLLRTQYARFELADNDKVLKLYARHSKTVAAELSIADIAQSELALNNQVINTVSKHTEFTFTSDKESEVLQHFAKENRVKMVDDKVRQISLLLVDKHQHKVAICLYYRKGNQRLTRARYSDVLSQVIDWQWFISEKVNNKTPVRPLPTPSKTQKAAMANSITNAAPLAENDESTYVAISVAEEVTAPTTYAEDEETSANDEHQLAQAIAETISEQAAKKEQSTMANSDSEIIFAIDKLVELKQAGHLTDHQFEVAKAKLLKGLITD